MIQQLLQIDTVQNYLYITHTEVDFCMFIGFYCPKHFNWRL